MGRSCCGLQPHRRIREVFGNDLCDRPRDAAGQSLRHVDREPARDKALDRPAHAIIGLAPISLVCKVVSANGRPAVKLSDNPEKATGEPSEIEHYLRVFGNADRGVLPVLV